MGSFQYSRGSSRVGSHTGGVPSLTGRVRRFSKITGWVGLVRVASGRVGSGRVGSGRVGSGRVGSGRVGSGPIREKVTRLVTIRRGKPVQELHERRVLR